MTRFRINPVEILLFSLLNGVCIYSAYDLIYETPKLARGQFYEKAYFLNRSIAQTEVSHENIDIGCGKNQILLKTRTTGIRLQGKTCEQRLTRVKVTHEIQNQSDAATVFANFTSGEFVTEYMTLKNGINTFHINYYHEDHTVTVRQMIVEKIPTDP